MTFNPIADLIRRKPSVVKTNLLGKLTTSILQSLPSEYDTEGYRYKLDKAKGKNVRIMFSGLHDNNEARYAQKLLQKKYANSTIYVFGHDQLEEALLFALTIEPFKTVTVYGYSWGGDDARRFVDNYKGRIKAVHFLDPVRKNYLQLKILKLKKDVPTTFTPAGPYEKGYLNDIKEATVDALRFLPSLKFINLPKVKDHVDMDSWISNVIKYLRLNKLHKRESLADTIRLDPLAFLGSLKGQKMLRFANNLPSGYNTKLYPIKYKFRVKDNDLKIRIFFSGLPDSDFFSFGKTAMELAYGPKNLYMFGHKQLPLALLFAKVLDPLVPVLIYGFSWGSTAARDFADAYEGKISGVHFMDPMRKAPSAKSLLELKKDAPLMTYTAAFTRPHNKLSAAIHDALRFTPSKQFKVYDKVKDHLALAQWLRQLKELIKLDKAATYNNKKGNNMYLHFNKVACMIKQASIYDGMSLRKILRLIKKKIKKVPDVYPYLTLLPRLKLAYMIRCLKKAQSKDNLNNLFGSIHAVAHKDPRWNQRGPADFFFAGLKERLNLLDPLTYKQAIGDALILNKLASAYKRILKQQLPAELYKQAVKRIKKVPRKINYHDLSLVLKLAYMVRLLKKAKAEAWYYGTSGSLINKNNVFSNLDPLTYEKAQIYGI